MSENTTENQKPEGANVYFNIVDAPRKKVVVGYCAHIEYDKTQLSCVNVIEISSVTYPHPEAPDMANISHIESRCVKSLKSNDVGFGVAYMLAMATRSVLDLREIFETRNCDGGVLPEEVAIGYSI